jgi:hypothetical protein
VAHSPQYTATLLDPCVANRASALEIIAAMASADTSCRAMIVKERATRFEATVQLKNDDNDSMVSFTISNGRRTRIHDCIVLALRHSSIPSVVKIEWRADITEWQVRDTDWEP